MAFLERLSGEALNKSEYLEGSSMRVLITGATGFVARYLIQELYQYKHELFLCAQKKAVVSIDQKSWDVIECDIRHEKSVDSLIRETRPEAIVHLAGISHVTQATESRAELSSVNVVGTHNLCAAADLHLNSVIFLFVSTALVYSSPNENLRCNEETPVLPSTPYAMSKLAGEWIVKSFDSPRFKSYRVRPFNHIGPGQSPDFVCGALAKRIFDTTARSIVTGNLDSKRDFSDVRDIVRAYRKIIERKPIADLFVLGRGKAASIASILDELISISGKDLVPEIDPQLIRTENSTSIVADCLLAKRELDWECVVDLKNSLRDIYISLESGKNIM